MRALLLAATLALLPIDAQASHFSARYDDQIQRAAKDYLPGIPWRLWKAQLYQESKLDPAARSHVGAEGIAQFMPGTWEDVSRAMGLGRVRPSDAYAAIRAGAYYMAQQRRSWRQISDYERHKLAAASYNAGLGNIRKAWRACHEAPFWDPVAVCLPDVTGRHAAETTTYVERIWRWWRQMELGL